MEVREEVFSAETDKATIRSLKRKRQLKSGKLRVQKMMMSYGLDCVASNYQEITAITFRVEVH